MGLAEDFYTLFEGNPNAYGTDSGGCIRGPFTPSTWPARIETHLLGGTGATTGKHPIGIYPLATPLTRGQTGDKSMWVKWGCSDIDLGYEASWPLAYRLYQAFEILGIKAWIEKSRSKGFHVWVFANDWVPAETMRNAFLAAHKIADIPPKEVNPKQVSGVELGNYVRLPYPHGATDRQVVMVPDSPRYTGSRYSCAWFVHKALGERTSPSDLEAAAKLYVPPARRATVQWDPSEGVNVTRQITDKLNGLAWTIWKDGPLDGKDRSSTLQRLAYLCVDSGLTPAESYAVVSDADRRWGKYRDRPDAERQLTRIVDNAFGMNPMHKADL